jgi:exodeoxyribonuclease VII small subunit
MSTNPPPEPELAATFEDALHQLEGIVDELERGAPGLSEALANYELGVRLLARCHGELDRAERSVALLTGVDEAGNPLTAPFDASATEAATPSTIATTPKKSRKRPAARSDDDDGLIPF